MSNKGIVSQRKWTKLRTLIRGGKASWLPPKMSSVKDACKRAGLPQMCDKPKTFPEIPKPKTAEELLVEKKRRESKDYMGFVKENVR